MAISEGGPLLGLRWGIKASFTAYVARMPDGRVMVGDGADVVGGREIRWSFSSLDTDATLGTTTLDFRGVARFRGHGGMLFVRLAEPRVIVRADQATLTMPDYNDRAARRRITVATFTLEAARLVEDRYVWHVPDVRLNTEALGWFGHAYPSGAPMDAMTLCIPADFDGTRDASVTR